MLRSSLRRPWLKKERERLVDEISGIRGGSRIRSRVENLRMGREGGLGGKWASPVAGSQLHTKTSSSL